MDFVKTWQDWQGPAYERALAVIKAQREAGAVFSHDDAWHAHRCVTVTGTDAAAINGTSKWRSALDVYLDKTLQTRPQTTHSKYLVLGGAAEPAILKLVGDRLHCRVEPGTFACRKNSPWSRSQIDGIAHTTQYGDVILEIKTSHYGAGFGDPCTVGDNGIFMTESDEVPVDYWCQVQKQLLDAQGEPLDDSCVCGPKTAILACFVWAKLELQFYVIHLNEKVARGIYQQCGSFMFRNLMPQVPPPMTAAEKAQDFAMKKPLAGDMVKDASAMSLALKLAGLKERIKAATEEKERLEQALCGIIGEHEGVTTLDGVPVATWKTMTSNRFDSKAFKEADPATYEKFCKQSTTRTFRLKI